MFPCAWHMQCIRLICWFSVFSHTSPFSPMLYVVSLRVSLCACVKSICVWVCVCVCSVAGQHWQSCLKAGRLQICSAFGWSSYLLSPPVKNWRNRAHHATQAHTCAHRHTHAISFFFLLFSLVRLLNLAFSPSSETISPSLAVNGAEPKTNYYRQSFRHEIPTSCSPLSSPLSLIFFSRSNSFMLPQSHHDNTHSRSNSNPWSPFSGEWLLLSEYDLGVFLVSTRAVHLHAVWV